MNDLPAMACLSESGLESRAEAKDMLYCVITRAEVFELKEILAEVPGSSFATVSEVSEVIGQHLTTDEAVELAMASHYSATDN